ncbi:MAG: zinc ribbon domain-containing protein [Verrucomicrobiae bacterium]
MTTYIYETIPAKKGASVRHYEIKQSMKDSPLAKHPETGEAIRRVVVGGYGILKSGSPSPRASAPSGGHRCCGGGGCGCH